jgi:ribonucleotide reductase beta subunit family protein with ferritin-like domain
MNAATAKSPLDNITYDGLYARWERGNWSATQLDFSEDRRQWQEEFSAFERKAARWNYALFFHGEDSVAETSPRTSTPPRARSRSTS